MGEKCEKCGLNWQREIGIAKQRDRYKAALVEIMRECQTANPPIESCIKIVNICSRELLTEKKIPKDVENG